MTTTPNPTPTTAPIQSSQNEAAYLDRIFGTGTRRAEYDKSAARTAALRARLPELQARHAAAKARNEAKGLTSEQVARRTRIGGIAGILLTVGILIAVGAFIIHAASSGSAPSTSAYLSSLPASTVDSVFVAAVHQTSPHSAGSSDALLIGLAHAACGDFQNGGSLYSVIADGQGVVDTSSLTVSDVGTIIGAGVSAYCPQYKDKLPS